MVRSSTRSGEIERPRNAAWTDAPAARILVIGFGNTLRRDDGAGLPDRRGDRALEPPGGASPRRCTSSRRSWPSRSRTRRWSSSWMPGPGTTVSERSESRRWSRRTRREPRCIHCALTAIPAGSDPRRVPVAARPRGWSRCRRRTSPSARASPPRPRWACGGALEMHQGADRRGRMPRTSSLAAVSQRRCPESPRPPAQDPDHERTHPPGGLLHEPAVRRQPRGGLPARGSRGRILDAARGRRDEPVGDGLRSSARGRPVFRLRWFTPRVEVDLCGHATLAAAHVLWEEGLLRPGVPALFETRSGRLSARRKDDWIELDFPAEAVTSRSPTPRSSSGSPRP